tara:strand:+ start:3021 stop:3845 length:825 start_codon:yes stop_codon:yes gene_type:complete
MPDITIPNTFVDGSTADAEQAMENVYLPKLVPDNLSVINGQLDNPNRDGWSLTREDVRRGHYSQSQMTAATANQDFFNDMFKDISRTSPVLVNDDGTFTPQLQPRMLTIPGCATSFYVPWTVSAVAISWHVSLIMDVGYLEFPPGVNQFDYDQSWAFLQLYVDGLPIDAVKRSLIAGARTMAHDRAEPATFNNEFMAPDTRNWSGSFVWDSSVQPSTGGVAWPAGITRLNARGWHTVELRLGFYGREQYVIGTPLAGVKQVRVKTRRMGYSLIR